MTEGALQGLTVLEYSHGVAASFAGKLLGDFGARVIKIEDPEGDPVRSLPPLLSADGSAIFAYLNTGKESVVINQRTAEGRDIVRGLASRADALIEDVPAQRARRLGLSYRAIKRTNPALVFVSITGFGMSGPRARYKATDLVSVAAGGLALTMPNTDETTGQIVPLRPGGYFSHFTAAVNAGILALAALMRRGFTDKGAYIDVSEQETILHNIARHVTQYTVDGGLPYWALAKSYGGGGSVLRCKDGYVHFHFGEEHMWQAMLDVMGRPAWAEEERFRRRDQRFAHWNEIEPRLEAWCMERTGMEIFHACQAKAIPCAPVNTPDRLIADPHVQARGALLQVAGLTMPGAPVRLWETPHAVRHPAPKLGQHTDDVLAEWLGYSRPQIEELRQHYVI